MWRSNDMRIAITGGGIGGLSLALALHDTGRDDVTVYESAPAMRELGVGINVMPHAVRELAELGLLDELTSIGIPTAEFVLFNKHGKRIWGELRGYAAGYRWPQISIHRGELLGILYRAVLSRLGPERVRTGHHLTRFGQTEDQVWAEFGDRTSGAAIDHIEADLLVGCDGIHSTVRRAFYPDEGPPQWNGIVLWRAITEGAPFLSGRTMLMAGYFGRRMVVYPISRQQEMQGRASINWVAEFKIAEGQPMPMQDWDHTARCEDVLAPFTTFDFPFLNVPELIRGAATIYQYPMVDRDPLPSWDFGRVTLLGDAAHPMYPTGGNGASQAILDARVLARELAMRASVEDAVTEYDALRRPATAAVVFANREGGPERSMALVEERAPDGFVNLEDVVSQEELEQIARSYKQIAGFDPETLNSRPSLSVRKPANQG